MTKKNAIFFACDQNFLFTLAVTLLSVTENSLKALGNADVLIYSQQDKELHLKIMPCEFTEYKFAVDTNFKHTNFKNFTQLTFARYELFSLLDKYKKALYIDVDVMTTGELQEMFDKY